MFHISHSFTHLKEDKSSTSGASVIRVDVHPNITCCSCPQVKIRVYSERFQLNVTLLKVWSMLWGNACHNSPVPWNQAKSLWVPGSTCWEGRCGANGSCPGCTTVLYLVFEKKDMATCFQYWDKCSKNLVRELKLPVAQPHPKLWQRWSKLYFSFLKNLFLRSPA